MKNTEYRGSISKVSELCKIEYCRVNGTESYSEFKTFIQGNHILDIVALTELSSWNTFIGDRTIYKDVKRNKWFASYNDSMNKYVDHKIPEHGTIRDTASNIAMGLHKRLKKEIEDYVKDSQHVGILLSGGMDSRIVAGILKQIQNERNNVEVTALCWGERSSRDPVYAEQIAVMYNWNFEHFVITPETLKRNIETAAKQGCFYAPQHLHAMPDVAQRSAFLGIECILAGSFGDSIGRGEYSRKKVMKLKPLQSCLGDPFGIIKNRLYKKCKMQTMQKIRKYHQLYKKRPIWGINELDYQLHYMRNQLNTCMSIISEYVPLYQCFTSAEVVKYMWSYHPDCRTDEVYLHLIKIIDKKMYEIPWARTGRRYLNTNDIPDKIEKSYHNYGNWARGELSEYLESLIFGGEIEAIKVFNMKQLRFVYEVNKKSSSMKGRKVDEIILWLASLAIFLKDNELNIEEDIRYSDNISLKGTIYLLMYLAKQKMKIR